METKEKISLEEAVIKLQAGEVIGIPTETVYGLAADARNEEAVAKIFAAKGRPSDNPLIVHIGDMAQLSQVVAEVTEDAKRLMEAFWPGALTVILPKAKGLAETVTAGLSTVGVRLPSHPLALQLLQEVQIPLAAPSANLSGRPSPTVARHVYDDLNGKIAGILDGGICDIGLESTVIDCTTKPAVILRSGGITKEAIEAVIGPVMRAEQLAHKNDTPKAPGMKYTHYAPKAPMAIVVGGAEYMQRLIDKAQAKRKRVGILVASEHEACYQCDVIRSCGTLEDMHTVAANIYKNLREFDEEKVDIIFCESFPEIGIGFAVMNRLKKAAGEIILREN